MKNMAALLMVMSLAARGQASSLSQVQDAASSGGAAAAQTSPEAAKRDAGIVLDGYGGVVMAAGQPVRAGYAALTNDHPVAKPAVAAPPAPAGAATGGDGGLLAGIKTAAGALIGFLTHGLSGAVTGGSSSLMHAVEEHGVAYGITAGSIVGALVKGGLAGGLVGALIGGVIGLLASKFF